MRNLLFLLITISVIFSSLVHAQNLYRSVDRDGRVTFSDKPPTSGKIQKANKQQNPRAPTKQQTTTDSSQSGEKSLYKTNTEIILYTAKWCPYCTKARNFLLQKRIRFKEIDVETKIGQSEFAKTGAKGIPLLLANQQKIEGFQMETYQAIFP